MEARPPLELVADIGELLDLFDAIVTPIEERIMPAVLEALGQVELPVVMVELHVRAEVQKQVEALPGAAPSA